MTDFDFLIVGSGLAGATLARLLTDSGKKVCVIEKRHEFGGNIRTHVEDGIVLHDYGPHIFHTSFDDVWSFVKKYCEMYDFVNSPIANYHGELYHLPFNMNTFHELWGVNTEEEAKKIINAEIEKENISDPKNLEEQAIKMVGRTIYEKLIKGYSEKQWGRPCNQLPASIIKRLPLRFTFDNNYFNDKHQGLPKGGYSVLIDNLLKGVEKKTDFDFFNHKDFASFASHIVFTGCIDEFFNFSYGRLSYRSLRFENAKFDVPDYQGNAVINYTSSDVPFTRITEAKHFDPFCLNHDSTIVTFEYPIQFSKARIPYYPISDEANSAIYSEYEKQASFLFPKVIFAGRLGKYKYYDMDDVIFDCMSLFKTIVCL
jgi:UDP-galactopyranose mutase